MSRKKIDTLNAKEEATLCRLERFARVNRLNLFNVKGSLFDRVRTIANNSNACPCAPKERPFCPCSQAIQECKDKGECFCRVFVAPSGCSEKSCLK